MPQLASPRSCWSSCTAEHENLMPWHWTQSLSHSAPHIQLYSVTQTVASTSSAPKSEFVQLLDVPFIITINIRSSFTCMYSRTVYGTGTGTTVHRYSRTAVQLYGRLSSCMAPALSHEKAS
jgi:hypothetical protein